MSGGKKAGALLTVLIAGMWVMLVVVDVVGGVSDIWHGLVGHYEQGEVGAFEIFMFSFDSLLSSKIFAVVSVLVAGGSLEELK